MTSKEEILENIQEDIVYSRGYSKYYKTDSYEKMLKIAKKEKNIFECLKGEVCLFFDIDIKSNSGFYEKWDELYEIIENRIKDKYKEYSIRLIILTSHSDIKKSYHVVVRMKNEKGENIYFQDTRCVGIVVKELFPEDEIDKSVYSKDRLFRTIYSSKPNEEREFTLVSDVNPIETFVGYTVNPKIILGVGEDRKITKKENEEIVNFLKKHPFYYHYTYGQMLYSEEFKCFIITVESTRCPIATREHLSNHQYVVINDNGIRMKCHDEDCKEKTALDLKYEDLPDNIKKEIKINILKYSEMNVHKEFEEIMNHHLNLNGKNIKTNIEEMTMTSDVNERENKILSLYGSCSLCDGKVVLTYDGIHLKCVKCGSTNPPNGLIQVDQSRFPLHRNYFIQLNQITNNYYGCTEDVQIRDFNISDKIFKDEKLRKLINTCMNTTAAGTFADILHYLYKDFVYCTQTDEWYFFQAYWVKESKKNTKLVKCIKNLYREFNKVYEYYENSQDKELIGKLKRIKSMLVDPTIINKIKEMAVYLYDDDEFYSKLDQNKASIPFLNGIYDLINNKFRKIKKEDYVFTTVGYEYDPTIKVNEVEEMIQQILPYKEERDYLLKAFSECLNGDIPNTKFFILVGDGANGKSQLLNFIKETMGDLGIKIEVTLLTRKRTGANEANSEKYKLKNKRYGFLSEPEDGEKFNISLLKELTGSEGIVARKLYGESETFQMETKMFLACNEKPSIKGEDKALWRRIRVVEFPSKFVLTPQQENEYKLNQNIPTMIKQKQWKQAMMNILIDYYNRNDIKEPESVKITTDEYRQENDNSSEFKEWLNSNICIKKDNILHVNDIHNMNDSLPKNKIKTIVSEWIKENHSQEDHINKVYKTNGTTTRGWKNFGLKFS